MSNEEMNDLSPGDIVRHVVSKRIWMVTANYGGRVTVVQTMDVTNPPECELYSKVLQRGETVMLPG